MMRTELLAYAVASALVVSAAGCEDSRAGAEQMAADAVA